MSDSSTLILFNTLRKFKLGEGDGDCIQKVSPSEAETVRRMVAMFFNPPDARSATHRSLTVEAA
jgi:hypothetical protein